MSLFLTNNLSIARRRVLLEGAIILVMTLVVAERDSYSQTPALSPNPSGNATAKITEEQANLQTLEPAEAIRGEAVTITGEFPKKPVDIGVELRSAEANSDVKVIPENVRIADDGQTFTFNVPRGARLGKYDVLVTFTKAGKRYGPLVGPISEGSTFRIVTGEPVKIDAIYPVVSYPEKDTFGFKIIGEGFSPVKEDNALVIEGRGLIPLCGGRSTTGTCVNEEIIDAGHEIRFWGLPLAEYRGVQSLRVRVGDQYSEKPIQVTLSQVDRKMPALIAVVVVALIIALIAFLLWRKIWTTSGRRRVNLLSAIFLDQETNTYSLSKLQFYLWTFAALFGYVYLSVSRSLVQGNLEFADIPENLPGILLVAVSTSALAVGITSAKGAKGAGDPGPSLADFVTTGGLVAPERVQFLVWTLVGFGTFVFLTLSTEPGQIANLPAVPERFLYLMGISSFGYLGGKMARKPGPVITQIEAEVGSLILSIHGSSLSPDATFKIDQQDLNPKILDNKEHPDGRPQVITKDDQPGFAKALRLTIADPDDTWLEGNHDLTITNPDGQKAVLAFTAGKEEEADH